MIEVLLATLINCSDVNAIIDSVREDKYLTIEAKEEIEKIIIEGSPQCEHNVATL